MSAESADMRLQTFVRPVDGHWVFGLKLWENAGASGEPWEYVAPLEFESHGEAREYADTDGRELVEHILAAVKEEAPIGARIFRQDLR